MDGPSGAFIPWTEHELIQGRCAYCGLIPKAVCTANPAVAYTHYDMTLTNKPTGRIVTCRSSHTKEIH